MKKYPTFLKSKYSKASQEEAVFMISGVLSRIILTTDYYKSNSDLKKFTTEVLKEDYRDYLFSNRNNLYSRTLRDIVKEKDQDKQLEKINSILKYIAEFEGIEKTFDNVKNKKAKRESNSHIRSWSNIINPKD